jgi:sec-independent protein translocase protein TatB
MFDIGFSELLVIGIVALIVIGPQKLPRVARTAGHLLGRLQRYVADVKADINREIELEELRKMRDSMQQAASEMKQAASDVQSAVDSELTKTAHELNRAAAGAPPESAAPATEAAKDEAPKAEPATVEPPKAEQPKQA